MNSKEEKSKDFCSNYVQEFGLSYFTSPFAIAKRLEMMFFLNPSTPFLDASLPNHTKMFELVHVVTSMDDFVFYRYLPSTVLPVLALPGPHHGTNCLPVSWQRLEATSTEAEVLPPFHHPLPHTPFLPPSPYRLSALFTPLFVSYLLP